MSCQWCEHHQCPGCPSPAEIRKQTAAIHRSWSANQRRKRLLFIPSENRIPKVDLRWSAPLVETPPEAL